MVISFMDNDLPPAGEVLPPARETLPPNGEILPPNGETDYSPHTSKALYLRALYMFCFIKL
jgi:hypothetical protein